MKWRDSDPQEELINAVAEYLQIVEIGGDPSEFLDLLGPLAVEVRQIAGIESLLRVDIAAPAPSEVARGRTSLYQSITRDHVSRATAGPKIIGLFAAAGLGLAVGAGFASGAVPMDPLIGLTDSVPFIWGGSSSDEQDEQQAEEPSPEASLVTPQASPRIIAEPISVVPAVVETPSPAATPAPNAVRSLGAPPIPSPSTSLPVTDGRDDAQVDEDDGDDSGHEDDSPTSVPTPPPTQRPSSTVPLPTQVPTATQPPTATPLPDSDDGDGDDDDGDDDDDSDDDDSDDDDGDDD